MLLRDASTLCEVRCKGDLASTGDAIIAMCINNVECSIYSKQVTTNFRTARGMCYIFPYDISSDSLRLDSESARHSCLCVAGEWEAR